MPKIPGISHKDAVRALEKAGFSVVRQSGHIVMGDGKRRLFGRFGIRPETVVAAQALPFVKIADAGDQILAAQFAKVPHAAG